MLGDSRSPILIPDVSLPEKLPLYSRDCRRRYCYVDAAGARELIAAGRVKALGTKTKIRALRWLAPGESANDEKPGPARRHYSHNHETAENPHGVWMLSRIRAEERDLHEGWRERLR